MPKYTGPVTRVVLADDHPIVMKGFASALQSDGIDVVGLAKSIAEAESMFHSLKPDVLVLDVRFGESLTGLDLARKILVDSPDARIVFLSQFDQDSLIKETYMLGGSCFVTKDCDPDELTTAVTKAHRQKVYFPPHIAERLAKLSLMPDKSPRQLLQPRELEIFKLIAYGLTINEIAEKLDLSLKTISNVSHTIREKLGVHRAAELTRLAVRHGLIEP